MWILIVSCQRWWAWFIRGYKIKQFRSRPRHEEGIWKRSFFSTVRPTVYTNPSEKRSFSKTLLKVFENNVFLSFSCAWKTFLKQERFENDAVTIVTWFPRPTVFQTRFQNDERLFRGGGRIHLIYFQSESSRFQFSLASGRGQKRKK